MAPATGANVLGKYTDTQLEWLPQTCGSDWVLAAFVLCILDRADREVDVLELIWLVHRRIRCYWYGAVRICTTTKE